MLPTSPSQVRQNYRPECEAAINSHAALEFHASFRSEEHTSELQSHHCFQEEAAGVNAASQLWVEPGT